MRILALDLGARRVGVAISDPLGLTAQGLPTLRPGGKRALLDAVRKLVDSYEVERIVVGLPRNMDGTLGPAARKALAVAEALRTALELPVDTWDERLTTVAAERALDEGNLRGPKRREIVDRIAAQLILEGYLESQKREQSR